MRGIFSLDLAMSQDIYVIVKSMRYLSVSFQSVLLGKAPLCLRALPCIHYHSFSLAIWGSQ